MSSRRDVAQAGRNQRAPAAKLLLLCLAAALLFVFRDLEHLLADDGYGRPMPQTLDGPSAQRPRASAWPPSVGAPYPSLTLTDSDGRPSSLADLRGKVVLVEMIGMTCPACNAFAGAHEPRRGGFNGVVSQPGLESLDTLIQRFAKVSPRHRDLTIVHLLAYGSDDRPGASPADARAWARHFRLDPASHRVLVTDADFGRTLGRAGIPAFDLLDRAGVLRARAGKADSLLYDELLPRLGRLLGR